jgi:hypothetical protein
MLQASQLQLTNDFLFLAGPPQATACIARRCRACTFAAQVTSPFFTSFLPPKANEKLLSGTASSALHVLQHGHDVCWCRRTSWRRRAGGGWSQLRAGGAE